MKLLVRLTLCSLLFLNVPACAVFDDGSGEQRSFTQVASDTRITAAIKAKLINDPEIKAANIGVNTYLGVVTLSGYVPTGAIRQRVIAITQTVSGLQKIITKLVVKQS